LNKSQKQITEDDILAAILKVKPTEEMPRPKSSKKKKTTEKPEK